MPTTADITAAFERKKQKEAPARENQEKAIAAAAGRAFDLIKDPRWDWFLAELNGLYDAAESERRDMQDRILPGGTYLEPPVHAACEEKYIRADERIKVLYLLRNAPNQLIEMAGGEETLDK